MQPPTRAIAITLQILEATGFIHDHGIIHRDLKPGNVLLSAATEASDLYSIGMNLYELLTGCLPFRGELVATVALQQLNDQPAPPARINHAISPGLNAIVLHALEKSPEARIGSCRAFAATLHGEMSKPAAISR